MPRIDEAASAGSLATRERVSFSVDTPASLLISVSDQIHQPNNLRTITAYSSLFAAKYPPNPIEIAPAVNSAKPAKITTFVFPSADNPAVNANGTVNPSDNPIIASETVLGSILAFFSRSNSFSVLESECCDSMSREDRAVEFDLLFERDLEEDERRRSRFSLIALGERAKRLVIHWETEVPEERRLRASAKASHSFGYWPAMLGWGCWTS